MTKKTVGLSIICFLIVGISIFSVFTVSMVGDFPSKVEATPYDDLYDICLLINTYVDGSGIDWAGFRDCVYQVT